VGSYPAGATPLGVMDMSGNVFEWVHDVWDINYYNYSPAVNPQGPESGTKPSDDPSFVIRGGSYRPQWFYPRAFNRHWGHHGYEGVGADAPYYRNNQVGFRCAR
jgi:serine/threonine-protein kinase